MKISSLLREIIAKRFLQHLMFQSKKMVALNVKIIYGKTSFLSLIKAKYFNIHVLKINVRC